MSPGRAWAQTGSDRIQDGDHRVAAGRGVIGQEQRPAARRAGPGSRPATRPSLGSSPDRPRGGAAPVRRSATRLLSGDTVHAPSRRAASPAADSQSSAGPGGSAARPARRAPARPARRPAGSVTRTGRRPRAARRASPPGATDRRGQHVAGRQAGRAEPGQQVGRGAAEDRRHPQAAREGHVAADARPGRADVQGLAGPLMATAVPSPTGLAVQPDDGLRPGHGDRDGGTGR